MDGWLRSAVEDAERRGLPALKPLLETLARATAALREADRQARERENAAAGLDFAVGAAARAAPDGPPQGRPLPRVDAPDGHRTAATAGPRDEQDG